MQLYTVPQSTYHTFAWTSLTQSSIKLFSKRNTKIYLNLLNFQNLNNISPRNGYHSRMVHRRPQPVCIEFCHSMESEKKKTISGAFVTFIPTSINRSFNRRLFIYKFWKGFKLFLWRVFFFFSFKLERIIFAESLSLFHEKSILFLLALLCCRSVFGHCLQYNFFDLRKLRENQIYWRT